MSRKILWLSFAILLGLASAAVIVAMPAQAAKSQPAYNVTGDDPPSGQRVTGVINSFPADLVGRWTVENVVYTATTSTHFEMSNGPFYVGACVRVSFDQNSHNALAISTQDHEECGSEASQQLIGLIDKVPSTYTSTVASGANVTATWQISGTQFVSTPATEFETENGPLVVGACAQVKYRVVNGVNLAGEINSEKMYRCLGPVAFNQAFGRLVTFPSNLIGSWVISDTTGMSLTFMSTASTVVFDKGAALQTGACVGVKYYFNGGMNIASFILVGGPQLCEGRLGNNQPPSKIVATVGARPTGVISGTWVLAGVNFTATQQTEVEEEDNHLVVGSCAEAKYDPTNGAMLLHELESEDTEGCQTESGAARFKLFGAVEMMPTSGLTGTWQVSGVTFQAVPTTTLESRHGIFAIGAFVKVDFTYDPTTGKRTALAIKTHVAPGFGRENFIGRFDGWIFNPQGD
ncbi:MAG TPA: DUF5666 domain-containing protein, partial [Anaerolineales bacterium]